MSIQDDLDRIAVQESTLILPAFTPDTAWQIGTLLRDLAVARKYSLVVDVRRFGSPHQQLFYTALEGTTPDNARWVQRKINTVARMHRSSYRVGLTLALEKHQLHRPLRPARRRLRRPRRLLPSARRCRRRRRRRHRLRPAPARGPQPRRRGPLPHHRPRPRSPQTRLLTRMPLRANYIQLTLNCAVIRGS